MPSINGISLHTATEALTPEALRERAYGELLRQHAVKAGVLPNHAGLTAPVLGEPERLAIQTLLDQEVSTPAPTEEECARYYAAHPSQFMVGQALHVRHILFAVTPGVNVHALVRHAEKALLELCSKEADADRFAQLAREMSNCPTSAQGGDLGWITPEDCAPELANELFHQSHSEWGMGVHPRLVHTRFGFHIIEVLGRRKGKKTPYAQVRERIAAQLQLQSRARGLNQFMCLLAGAATVEGLDLNIAKSPLVQ